MSIVVNKQLELGKTKEYRLSIQSDLNGFSFSVVNDTLKKIHFLYQSDFSCEKGHFDMYLKNTSKLINSLPLLSYKFKKVNIIYDTPKYALIPKHLYKQGEELESLSKLHQLEDLDEIDVIEVPEQDMVILFAVNSTFINCIKNVQQEFTLVPSIYPIIVNISRFQDYNKIFFQYHKGQLNVIAAEGNRLVYCNSFPAIHFNSALYFLFLALKQVQFNPELTTVYISGNLNDLEIMDIAKYFSKVKHFRNADLPLGPPEVELKFSSLTFDL